MSIAYTTLLASVIFVNNVLKRSALKENSEAAKFILFSQHNSQTPSWAIQSRIPAGPFFIFYNFSAALNFAERDLGFCSTSFSDGKISFLVKILI